MSETKTYTSDDVDDIVTVFQFDQHGHYIGETLTQVAELESGQYGPLVPDDCVTFAPPSNEDLFFTISDDKSQWIGTPWPTNAAECVGIFLKHHDHCDWTNHMRDLFEEFTQDNEQYELHRDDDLTLTVIKKAEKTQEELEFEQAEQQLKEFDAQIESLKSRMSLAMLQNDQNTINQLRAEYAELMGISIDSKMYKAFAPIAFKDQGTG